ncbi:PilN domain-containing protein [Aestuariirhabdus sp. Z084]|uniref:PilN domain-containing protein n=1 Tax=Aestuariirhabdus haliotis TaxID=2918751 RepID=UPI00201B41EB|nr:PilN domain-containing protein [Aestuariirhabdus haliotis]MCL6414954.1 PilN domain-containing protein [Aestuariirhabdus haliotis]MCL6418886.1 PilN domain-containing protein [Aestuariirhabdus haliotis]
MARINLLPWREELREEQKKQFLTVLAGIAIIAAGVVFLAGREVEGMIDHQNSRNEFVKKEIKVLDEKIKEISALRKKREELLARMKVIQELQGTRPVIVRVFDEVARSVPDGVYFSSLAISGNNLVVKGIAESNNRVSSLMRDFDQSEWFASPNLQAVNKARSGTGSDFSLTVTQVNPNQSQPGKKGGKK